MDSRIRNFLLRGMLLGLVILVLCGCAGRMTSEVEADNQNAVIEPEVARRDVSPPKIDTDDFEIGGYIGMMSVEDFGSNFVYGASLNYHVSENIFVQGTYGRTDTDKTSFEILSGGTQLLTDDQRELTYYDLSFGYNLLPGEVFVGRDRAFNSALYVLAGVGNTSFADSDFFTLVFGAGYRMLLLDSLAMHVNVRDHMFDSDILGQDKTTHNIEFTLSMNYFF